MKKSERLNIIKEIITNHEIAKQEEILEYLKEYGVDTTQATISRDLKELNLEKVSGKTKKFKYEILNENVVNSKYANIFRESVISIDYSLNIVVVKTYSGNASGVGFFLDKLDNENILGTISGDDTVMVICRNVGIVPELVNRLKRFLV